MWQDRKDNKKVQLVKNLEECDSQVLKEMLSQDYRIEVKEDGIFSFMPLVEGVIEKAYARTGNVLKNLEGLLENVENAFAFNESVVLTGEVCNDRCSLEVLGAMIKSSRKKPLSEEELELHKHTYFVPFDMVTLEEFNEGISETPSLQRRQWMEEGYDTRFSMSPDSRCRLSTIVQWKAPNTVHELESIANTEVAQGAEGIVGKANFANWEAGRKNFLNFKIVSGYDIDLLCIGYEEGKEGTKREGMINKLIFQWRDFGNSSSPLTTLAMDGRATDAMRIEWLKNPEEIMNTVFKIHGLCLGSKGSIRLGKFREQRLDKSIPDII